MFSAAVVCLLRGTQRRSVLCSFCQDRFVFIGYAENRRDFHFQTVDPQWIISEDVFVIWVILDLKSLQVFNLQLFSMKERGGILMQYDHSESSEGVNSSWNVLAACINRTDSTLFRPQAPRLTFLHKCTSYSHQRAPPCTPELLEV